MTSLRCARSFPIALLLVACAEPLAHPLPEADASADGGALALDAGHDAGGACSGFSLLDSPARGRIMSDPYSVPPRIVGLDTGGFAVLYASPAAATLQRIPVEGDWLPTDGIAVPTPSPQGVTDLAIDAEGDGVLVAVASLDAVRWAEWNGTEWGPTGSTALPEPDRSVDDLTVSEGTVAFIEHRRQLPPDPPHFDDVVYRGVETRTGATHDALWPGASSIATTARIALEAGLTPVMLAHVDGGTVLTFDGMLPTRIEGCDDPLALRVAGRSAWIACGSLRVFSLFSAAPDGAAPLWEQPGTAFDPWFSDVLPLTDGTALVAAFADDQRIDLFHVGRDGVLLAQTSIDLGYGRLNHPVELAASPDGTYAVLWSRWGTGDVVRFRLCTP